MKKLLEQNTTRTDYKKNGKGSVSLFEEKLINEKLITTEELDEQNQT